MADNQQTFQPHIDAGFPPSVLSYDGNDLLWASDGESKMDGTNVGHDDDNVSRLTILMYVNDDSLGGATNFYQPKSQQPQQPTLPETKQQQQ